MIVKKSRRLKTFIVIIACIVLATVIGLYSANAWYQNGLEAVSETVSEQEFIVEPGETTQEIADRLYSKGFIRNARVFGWYVKNSAQGDLQTGQYRLSPHLDVEEIVEILAGGKVDTRFITIVPGWRLDEIEAHLIAEGFDAQAVATALSSSYDIPIFDDVPKDATLEGYIFPETLQITTQTTVSELIERHIELFYAALSPELLAGIEAQGLTFHEAVILASIVQQEEADPELQRTIAQVYLKRFKDGMVLGADPTFFYAAAIAGVEPSITIDSPYNTRIYGGLPPGPISNFNLSALEAVANPADTDFLFFVAGDDGTTHFSKTEAEHIENTQKYCIELCRL